MMQFSISFFFLIRKVMLAHYDNPNNIEISNKEKVSNSPNPR